MSTIEFTTTSACNFGCTYCFEGHISKEQNKSRIINCKAQYTLDDAIHFIEIYRKNIVDDDINVAFWGGEPFLNWEFAKSFMLHFKDDYKISFMFYSNGSLIKKYFKELKNIKDIICKNGYDDRLFIQVSYDGITNDFSRIDKNQKGTSKKALQGFQLLKKLGIRCSMKSTIIPKHFKYLFDNFLDIIQYDFSYCPSPDTHTIFNKEDVQPYLNDLKENLFKIMQYMYNNNIPLNRFAWFRKSRAMCRTGYHYATIDVDGSIFPCHGIMYNKEDHIITNIKDIDLGEKLQKSSKNFESYALSEWQNDKCKNCNVNYCIRCPAASAMQSKNLIENYYERYCFVNNFLCSVFHINDHFNKAITKLYLDNKPDLLK